MKDYQLFLLDLDGTIYRGKDTIDSGVNFVKRLEEANKQYLFLTNNTTRTPQMIVDKLRYHGLKTDVKHIYTPSMAVVSYLLARKSTDKKIGVYIIGEFGLWHEILSHQEFTLNEQNPDYVVVGMDRDLTYAKIKIATRAIRNGAIFIGTNADLNLPDGKELLPGNGSQCAMIAAATGQTPLYIGKPQALIVEMVLAKSGYKADEALLVGDGYDTDVKAGFNSHVDQLLVFTGVTQKHQLKGKRQPTLVANSLDEIKL